MTHRNAELHTLDEFTPRRLHGTGSGIANAGCVRGGRAPCSEMSLTNVFPQTGGRLRVRHRLSAEMRLAAQAVRYREYELKRVRGRAQSDAMPSLAANTEQIAREC